eukprot:gnl/MRDRNA2_/MRDRNA2_144904_c0_seq1.p1 gnl/MRDRNA2_/MRDRNA2_144904_c0~~gnl/MRDRNA2_/MRDRNA2_144904_c0_seq1.p1  ORF type:complete len:450 (+),score=88.77 gnl/MRDRNA2_/MRDRNA2_144904_c0_seq1:2-1351(+)
MQLVVEARGDIAEEIAGKYVSAGSNVGRPVFQGTSPSSGIPVLIYFWEDNDNDDNTGWWIGSEVGGQHVWAFNSSIAFPGPPSVGWQVPWNGDVDEDLMLVVQDGDSEVCMTDATTPGVNSKAAPKKPSAAQVAPAEVRRPSRYYGSSASDELFSLRGNKRPASAAQDPKQSLDERSIPNNDARQYGQKGIGSRFGEQDRSKGENQEFYSGDKVQIVGLQKAVHMNGQSAILEYFDDSSQAWRVQLINGDEAEVKPQNIVLQESPKENQPELARKNSLNMMDRSSSESPPPPPPPLPNAVPAESWNEELKAQRNGQGVVRVPEQRSRPSPSRQVPARPRRYSERRGPSRDNRKPKGKGKGKSKVSPRRSKGYSDRAAASPDSRKPSRYEVRRELTRSVASESARGPRREPLPHARGRDSRSKNAHHKGRFSSRSPPPVNATRKPRLERR